MMFKSTAAAIVILAATTAWAQGVAPSTASGRAVPATSNALAKAEQTRAQSAARLRVEEMGKTVARMHALLKQMQARAAANSAKDPLAKANLEMWGLLLSDLDKQYEQLSAAARSRDDVEARRAAMYKAAEERARAARSGQKMPVAPGTTPGTSGEATSMAAPAPAQPAPVQASPTTPAPTSSPN